MKRREVLSLFAIVAASAGLAACGNEVPTVAKPVKKVEKEVPNLDSDQIRAVLNDLTKVLSKADEAKNAELLVERLQEPGLSMRQGYYNLAAKADAKIPKLLFDQATATVTKSNDWPRAIVLGTELVEGELPSLILITQAEARAPYRLKAWARMFPNSQVQTIKVSEGSPVIKLDSTDYVESPLEAFKAWISRLNGAELDVKRYPMDDFTKFYLDEKKRINEQVVEVGSVDYKAFPQEKDISAVKLADGSALVFAYLSYTMVYKRTSEKGKLTVQGVQATLLDGNDDEVKAAAPVTATYLVSVAMTIPAVGSDAPINVIAAERVLRSVTR
ncbi:hypothetical protein HMPREF0044_0890 [Gleimia coleocanis DSM 15436]|uniref:Tat pathway signal sequence domain protein n=1 Tax=Gleimia coleocanis DSM 15436 TaxID=525245 RepID=C0W012_9ACTO|nr:hypothetical protein [Gleimia coleocanis]EEH63871.1 hypothetical protein HMPREF0044_0890 [Gleimia coleocanis DSM 15436]